MTLDLGPSLLAAFLRAHQAIYRRTDGRVGHRLAGPPSLLLHTTGRRSGLRRTAVLVYARDGSDFVVVASNDGQDHHPAWLLNILADPDVTVQVARRSARGRARVILPGDPDYARLWALVNKVNHRRYEGYQRRTTRPIPLIGVTPSRAAAPDRVRRSGHRDRALDGRVRPEPAVDEDPDHVGDLEVGTVERGCRCRPAAPARPRRSRPAGRPSPWSRPR